MDYHLREVVEVKFVLLQLGYILKYCTGVINMDSFGQ